MRDRIEGRFNANDALEAFEKSQNALALFLSDKGQRLFRVAGSTHNGPVIQNKIQQAILASHAEHVDKETHLWLERQLTDNCSKPMNKDDFKNAMLSVIKEKKLESDLKKLKKIIMSAANKTAVDNLIDDLELNERDGITSQANRIDIVKILTTIVESTANHADKSSALLHFAKSEKRLLPKDCDPAFKKAIDKTRKTLKKEAGFQSGMFSGGKARAADRKQVYSDIINGCNRKSEASVTRTPSTAADAESVASDSSKASATAPAGGAGAADGPARARWRATEPTGEGTKKPEPTTLITDAIKTPGRTNP